MRDGSTTKVEKSCSPVSHKILTPGRNIKGVHLKAITRGCVFMQCY